MLDEKYQGKDDILGKNLLTMTNGINSSRSIMHAGQLDQISNLENPEIAGVRTNYENIVGSYSSAYYKADDDYTVMDKIVKYPNRKESIYTLILRNERTREYHVITKKPGVILTETYGYKFNNEKLDKLQIGSKIKKNKVLYRSTSFDENMNYRLGINAKTLYTMHPLTIEDAIIISRSLADKLISIEYDRVYISLNDNDILLLLYGDKNKRKSFPDIGEELKDSTLAVKRRIDYSRAFFDLKEENMKKILPSDTPYYIPFSEDKVVDISIYSNKSIDDIPDAPYNKQILEYMKMEAEYHKKLKKKLGRIIEKKKYSDDLAELYSRVSRIIDPEYKWSDQSKKVFGNIIVEFLVEKKVNVVVGSKLCG